MSQTLLTITKKKAIVIACSLVILVIIEVWSARVRVTHYPYANCSQLKAATGQAYIHKGNPLYNPALDRNHNNIACEE